MLLSVKTIAIGEFKSLVRQNTFILLLGIFLFMASFSAYIGWSTKNTVTNVYNQSVKELVANNITEIPANPFASAPPLAILKNMTVYVFLIGSLLAIIVGYSAFIRERRAGVTKILFSRPFGRQEFLLGKIGGISIALFLVIMASFVLSLISVVLISGHMLMVSEIFRLFVFYLVSFVYMLIFSMLGLFFAIYAKSETLALLAPMIIWIFISFVMPQLTSSLDPTALLNPTSIQTALPQNNFFVTSRSLILPLSVSENYKTISRSLLSADIHSYPAYSLVFYFIILLMACFYAIKKFDVCEAEIDQ